MENLQPEEQLEVWDETERNVWSEFHQKWEEERRSRDKDFQKAVLDIKVDIGTLLGRQTQLTETQSRLMRELNKVEEELSQVANECDSKANQLHQLESDYQQQQHESLVNQDRITRKMSDFFRRMRKGDPAADSDQEPAPLDAHPTSAETLVNIVDADGDLIGPVHRIDPWNQWVEAIQDMPIRRDVKIRRNRKFSQVHLDSIYDRTEAKGVRWLSCMIQATGEIQGKRCVSCEKNQGAFEDCIILGDDMFQKCGNCEWNRQGCHGASGNRTNASDDNSTVQENEALNTEPAAAAPPTNSLATNQASADEENHRKEQAVEQAFAKASGLSNRPASMSQPTPSTEIHSPTVQLTPSKSGLETAPLPLPLSSGFTPANIRSRPESVTVPSTEHSQSPQLSPLRTSSGPPDSLEEITRENLVLKDNGTVYVYPKCVEGVPLVKIDENHPYWESSWPNVRSTIEPALHSWRAKLEVAVENDQRAEKRNSSKYQIGRQVNRGLKILEFLEHGDISPYQLLNKSYMYGGKGGITSYDTLFRLADTLSELAKFKLDITPLEWLRHRLHELVLEDGQHFNLAKTMHQFYNDPKLSALRSKHGFKNIGRPSIGRQSLGSAAGTPRPAQMKRKVLHSQASTPRSTPALEGSPLAAQVSAPVSAPSPKRVKNQHAGHESAADDLHTNDFSDADSWCGSPLNTYDWRIYQIKTRVYTSAIRVTQYWTWLEDSKRFEHQVLTEVDPPRWGVLKEPLNFNVRLDEIAEIVWNLNALRLQVIVHRAKMVVARKDRQPRGDLMVAFKRERTMKRFLSFCREKKIHLVEKPMGELVQRWDNLQSEQLPDNDEEATEDLRG
ncbi:hypothetical protein S40288_04263 [Stachybotrys chartarum IBT 40288]|nr:hypothetical protein S40288_04263 [Stachybotrys chartarum IBT 40288]